MSKKKEKWVAVLDTKEAELVMYETEPTLEWLQEKVGGLIELVKPSRRSVDVYVNEEGRMHGMAPSCVIRDSRGFPLLLVGPVVFVLKRAKDHQSALEQINEIVWRVVPYRGEPEPEGPQRVM